MAQRKPADKKTAKSNPEEAPRKERYEVKPEFWDNILDSLPPWGDEIAAIVLIVFGVVSFMSLFDVSSEASLSRAWSDALTTLFGYGSVIVSAAILLLGVVILLPKVGIVVKFPTYRILALEVAFIAALTLLHLSSGDAELRAVARAGEGGGVIGGAMSSLFVRLFGSSTSMILFVLLLIVSLGVAVGVRREQVTQWLRNSSQRLQNFSDQAFTEAQRRAGTSGVRVGNSTYASGPAASLMRIRPDPTKLPPSQRVTAEPPPLGLEEPKRVELTEEEKALFERPEKGIDYSVIGEVLKEKTEDGRNLVRRPDGRIRRYFSVESFREAKRVARRDKSLPDLELLRDIPLTMPEEDEINKNVVLIENTLLEFDIEVDVVDVRIGPTVTQYAVQPYHEGSKMGDASSNRTRLSKIASFSSDLSLSLSAKRLRMEIPVPGHSYMGIEVPNKNPSIVSLRTAFESRDYFDQTQKNRSPLYIPIGRDVSGTSIGIDLAGCPHLLIAGTTGSGKSVCIAALATALMLNNTPDQVQLVMLDPKMVELSRFNGLPHLIGPVETDQERIIEVLRWCTREMDRRYKILEENAARNISDYNNRLGQRRRKDALPYIVIMIDEVGDLMMSRPEETEHAITRLAQMARAVGMHLVVATQRPSVDVITGLIKANFPARISFAVASAVDSRVILDATGAETLLGRGDMLYLAQDAAGPRRLQGCYVSDDEVRSVVAHWRKWKVEQIQAGKWERQNVAPWERGLTRREFLAETDPMLEDAIELVIAEQEASASLIQRRLGLGYPRAARIMDLLEELGVIEKGTNVAGRSRRVLIEKGKDPFKEIIDERTRKR